MHNKIRLAHLPRVLFAIGLLGASVASMAQGTVNIYGLTDVYFGRASGSVSAVRVNEGGHAASQLGFRGTEDLGGGLSASFTLEGGIGTDTGAGNVPGPGYAFTRQSFVGVSSRSLGSLTLGRQYTPIFRTVFRADVLGANSIFSPNILWGQVDGLNDPTKPFVPWAARANDAILYSSPSSLPVQVNLMWAPGEASNNTSSGNYTGLAAAWSQGPFWVAYGYQRVMNGTSAAPVASPVASVAQVIAADYDAGPIRIGANFGRQGSRAAGAAEARLSNVNAMYRLNASNNLTVSYSRRTVEGSARGQTAWTLGYNHLLSKRTEIYVRSLHLTNRSNASVSLGGIPITANSGDDGSLTAVGIIHRF